jgi:hypothetical protein
MVHNPMIVLLLSIIYGLDGHFGPVTISFHLYPLDDAGLCQPGFPSSQAVALGIATLLYLDNPPFQLVHFNF